MKSLFYWEIPACEFLFHFSMSYQSRQSRVSLEVALCVAPSVVRKARLGFAVTPVTPINPKKSSRVAVAP